MTNPAADDLASFKTAFDARLADWMTPDPAAPARLAEAMQYALLSPGKRLRPFLLTRCCELAGGVAEDAVAAGVALEMVHAFSLVHDDLPAMDDDDLRRGRPTVHKMFDEALAILVGDALLARAFEILATHGGPPPVAAQLVGELARATGWVGMIGGQAADLEGEQLAPQPDRVAYIHARKTAALFVAACRMGGWVGGAGPELVARLGDYGLHLGLAFQTCDDLLDVEAVTEAVGKQTGKDDKRGKQTYVRCVGINAARAQAEGEAERAIMALNNCDDSADSLRQLAGYVVQRTH